MDFQWIPPIWPNPKNPTIVSYAICSRPTRAFAARDELHGSGKVTFRSGRVLRAITIAAQERRRGTSRGGG
ncbi:hypothetical protein V8C35DRAFT_312995 [Trichoderma chlorosporum]